MSSPIHEHGHVSMISALGFSTERDLEAAEVDLGMADHGVPHRRALDLLVVQPVGAGYLAERLTAFEAIAGKRSGVLNAELVALNDNEQHLPKALAANVRSDDRY